MLEGDVCRKLVLVWASGLFAMWSVYTCHFWCGICVAPLSSSRHLSNRITPLPPDDEVCEPSFLSHPCGFPSFPSSCSSFISIDLSWDSFSWNCFPAGWAPVSVASEQERLEETSSSPQSKQSCTRHRTTLSHGVSHVQERFLSPHRIISTSVGGTGLYSTLTRDFNLVEAKCR